MAHRSLEYVCVGASAYHEIVGLSRTHVLQRQQGPVPRRSALSHLGDRLARFHQGQGLGPRIGHQLGRVQVVAVQGRAAGVPIPSGTGAQRLREVEPNVNGVAHLLNGALRQQVDMLIVRVVVILGRFRECRARSLRQPYPRLAGGGVICRQFDLRSNLSGRLPRLLGRQRRGGRDIGYAGGCGGR